MTNKVCKFVSVAEKVNHIGFDTSMSSLYTLDGAQVLGFTVINEDGTLEQNVQNPDTINPMFLIKVKPQSGPAFHLVTDGETYSTVSGKIHLKVDKGILLKYGPLSELDQILIKEAIKFYASLFA